MRIALALYRQLLRLLPHAFWNEFGAGMEQSFVERARRRTGLRRGVFVVSALLDVARTAVAERWPIRRSASAPLHSRTHFPDRLRQDVRFATRSLRSRAGFSVAVIATLALGVGANIAVFSLVDTVLLRPLPVVRPDRLVGIFTVRGGDRDSAGYGVDGGLSYSAFRKLQTQARSLVSVAGFIDVSVGVEAGVETRQLTAGAVSGNYFDLLGLRPAVGRLLQPSDDRLGAGAHVAVLSHALFARAFASDPHVIGQSMRIGGTPFIIAGVAPQGFRGTRLSSEPELWVPLTTITELRAGGLWNGSLGKRLFGEHPLAWVATIARRGDTATLNATADEVHQLLPSPPSAPGSPVEARTVVVQPLVESASLGDRRDLVRFLAILASVVATTLVIACLNVAHLTWTRTAERARELAVRGALGASRPRLIWQLMLEHIILATAAGAAALFVGMATLRLLSAFSLPGGIPIEATHLGLSGRAVSLAAVLSAVSALVIGLGPALRRSHPQSAVLLRSHGAAGGRRSPDLLTVAQVALTLLLLVCASLFLRSLREGLRTHLGFEPAPLAAVSVDLFRYGYNAASARSYYDQALASAAALPDVEGVALTTHLPLATLGTLPFDAPGGPYTSERPLSAGISSVTPDFFRVMGIPLIEGRVFADTDARGSAPVAIVNEFAARQLFAGQPPIGREIRIYGAKSASVIGVVRDSKYAGVQETATPMVYLCFSQETPTGGVSVVVKSRRAQQIVAPLRDAIQRIDRHVALYDARAVAGLVAAALAPQRFGTVLLGLFACLDLAIAVVGIYSVVGYTVARRKPELGIRLALGATGHDVLRVVLRRTGTAIAVGLLIGVAAAVPVSATLARFLIGVSPLDRWSFAAAASSFVLAAAAAVVGPARRAVKTDPLGVLRSE